jgi:hypothetical protein
MNNACEVVSMAITSNGSATPPFVIPSEAEGSAVLLINREGSFASNSRPACSLGACFGGCILLYSFVFYRYAIEDHHVSFT